jgi:hypothetical protein
MKSHRTLLRRILQALVDEWGHEEVAEALSSTTVFSTERPTEPKLRRSRLSAIEQVERAAIEGDKKEALLRLAERYDRRQLLRSVADVREFLLMMDERPIGMKDRQEAFRALLRSLEHLPVERLQQLVLAAQHSGPSELGPLSDAITAASERLPRQEQAK